MRIVDLEFIYLATVYCEILPDIDVGAAAFDETKTEKIGFVTLLKEDILGARTFGSITEVKPAGATKADPVAFIVIPVAPNISISARQITEMPVAASGSAIADIETKTGEVISTLSRVTGVIIPAGPNPTDKVPALFGFPVTTILVIVSNNLNEYTALLLGDVTTSV